MYSPYGRHRLKIGDARLSIDQLEYGLFIDSLTLGSKEGTDRLRFLV